MRFVDQVRVTVRAGRGGDGMVAWRREKFVPRGGPAGGDGGRGGDVVLVADPNLSTLLDLRYRQHLNAENGRPGQSRDKNGRAGEDLLVRVPVGTMVFVGLEELPEHAEVADEEVARPPPAADTDADEHTPTVAPPDDGPRAATPDHDLAHPGQTVVVAHGGRGGRGNIHFKSSTNRAPDKAEPGRPGEQFSLRLELKLLADVGIVGFPNVGKSTFIAKVSRARPKIAGYPFTTLVPQLGVVQLSGKRSMVIADVPGLIRGASEGKGLGHRFLRHLERTRVLLHILAPDPEPGRGLVADLDAIEAELEHYGEAFAGRPRVVAVNKLDLLSSDEEGKAQLREAKRALRARNIPVFPICAHTGEGIDAVQEAIWRRLEAVRSADAPAAAGPDSGP